jgi:hypothetical protein
MAALDEDDAAQRRRRKQRHEGETTMEDGDVAEHGQEIFEPLPSRREWDPAGYLRITVLRDTLARLGTPEKRRAFHDLASKNLARWTLGAQQPSSTVVEVLPGDWCDVTLTLTKRYGSTFAVLNMANAYLFGGGYAHGQVAQEENMFRRTDCHFHDEGYSRDDMEYSDAMHRLVSGADGRVYLDTSPRVCIKGAEERDGLGYGLLADEDVFPFFELRSAAVDMRGASQKSYDDAELRKRIAAQLDTCMAAGVRHVVLSAFGCGAFQNPSPIVAEVYKQEVLKRKEHFDVVAFAIFHAGYGPDNFGVFKDIIEGA